MLSSHWQRDGSIFLFALRAEGRDVSRLRTRVTFSGRPVGGTGRFRPPGTTYFCRQTKGGSAPHFLFRKENGPRPVQKKTFDRSGQT